MNFLLDAHMPRGLCAVLQAAGHDAVHTSQLPAQNRTTDQVINELSAQEQRVVVSKDADFYYSHLLHQRPYKLVLVRTGNIRMRSRNRYLPAVQFFLPSRTRRGSSRPDSFSHPTGRGEPVPKQKPADAETRAAQQVIPDPNRTGSRRKKESRHGIDRPVAADYVRPY